MLFQVRVEHHAHRTHQQSPGGQDGDPVAIEFDQPVFGHALQLGPEFAEVALEIDVEGLFDVGEFKGEIADQLLNDRAPQPVIGIAQQTAAGGQLQRSQGVLIVVQVAAVLAVEVADLADCRDAEADQIAMTVGGVALEIALQGRLFLGDRQLVVGQGEVSMPM